ncbi:hypothetical protein BHE74_00022871 [Ensete ventricosum]|nr:hypothetical protein BHE74_00022871 [Ensete ventricosum]
MGMIFPGMILGGCAKHFKKQGIARPFCNQPSRGLLPFRPFSLRKGHPNPHPASSARRGLRVRAPSLPPRRSPPFRRLLCSSSSGSAANRSWSSTFFINDLVLLSCDGLRAVLLHDDRPEIDSWVLCLYSFYQVPSFYFGGEEEDIPHMMDYEDHNLIEAYLQVHIFM